VEPRGGSAWVASLPLYWGVVITSGKCEVIAPLARVA
jgi:hypothetical protein